LIFGPVVEETKFKRHLLLTYRGLAYALKCLKGPSDKFIKTKQVKMPEIKPDFKTLLLDLDETLIHSCSLKENPKHVLTVYGDHGDSVKLGLNVRPFCLEFLEIMSQYYEVVLFTASSSTYANAIVNFLDPKRKIIIKILSRENCMETKNGFFIKDLRILKDRQL
jgi:CTD small phosphatase-like protein 2